MASTASPAPTSADLEEQLSRIRRSNAETQKFIEEQAKLRAEAAKLDRDRSVAVWQVAVSCLAAGAALFGAGIAFIKFFFP